MQKKKITVDELQFGMYVSELDRPWTETPFVFQGFHLRTEEELSALRKYCRHVFVDVARTEAPEPVRRAAAPAASFRIRGETVYPETATVEAEYRQALNSYWASESAVSDLLRTVGERGKVLEAKQLRESVTRLTDSVVRNPDAMLLVSRLREKSAEAHARALQVSVYMIVFGRYLQREREELELLGLLGLLQDIGKTRLPRALLEKKGALTAEEQQLAREHVQHSFDILSAAQGLPPALPALALLHHERHDGSGYPRGLKGGEIGLHGCIAGIADTFDALTAVRPYAEPLSPSSALSHLYKERGNGFHPELVEQFIQCVGVFPVGSVVELNTGEVGIVLTQNLVRRLKPRVMVVLDGGGAPVRPHRILDLDKDPKARPDEPYRIRRTLEQNKVTLDARELFL
jgi:HD-GYP domain-containing protein (c-di-GMP phosphodiesterase class II)